MNLVYKPIEKDDIEVIYDLSRRLIYRYEDPDIIDLDKALAWTKTSIEGNSSGYTAVFLDGHKAGYYYLRQELDFSWSLENLYVLPAYRGQGVGNEIIRHILQEADDEIRLYVFIRNTRAVKLYEKHGFIMHKRVSPTRMIMIHPYSRERK